MTRHRGCRRGSGHSCDTSEYVSTGLKDRKPLFDLHIHLSQQGIVVIPNVWISSEFYVANIVKNSIHLSAGKELPQR